MINKRRNSNFELLRILAMLGIIAIHYTYASLGGMIQNAVFPNFSWMFTHLIYSFAYPLVNCFVLITAYYLINQTVFSLRKPINLLIITSFYGIVGYMVSIVFNINSFSFKELIFSIFPFINGLRWFVETYIILILLAPFMNKALKFLTKNGYQLLICIQICIFSLWYSVGLSAPILDNGYGIINFVTLYLIGGYIRRFSGELKFFKKRSICILIFVTSSLCTFILSYFIYPFGYAFITDIIGAVSIFLFFEKKKRWTNNAVNSLSAATFDVYFVHSDANTSKFFIQTILHGTYFIDSVYMIPHMLFTLCVFWGLGYMAYVCREKLFSISINKIVDKVKVLNYKQEI